MNLYDILKKVKLWVHKANQWLPRVGGRARSWLQRDMENILGDETVTYLYYGGRDTHTHTHIHTKPTQKM